MRGDRLNGIVTPDGPVAPTVSSRVTLRTDSPITARSAGPSRARWTAPPPTYTPFAEPASTISTTSDTTIRACSFDTRKSLSRRVAPDPRPTVLTPAGMSTWRPAAGPARTSIRAAARRRPSSFDSAGPRAMTDPARRPASARPEPRSSACQGPPSGGVRRRVWSTAGGSWRPLADSARASASATSPTDAPTSVVMTTSLVSPLDRRRVSLVRTRAPSAGCRHGRGSAPVTARRVCQGAPWWGAGSGGATPVGHAATTTVPSSSSSVTTHATRPTSVRSWAVRGAWRSLVSISTWPPGASHRGAACATRRWRSSPAAPPSSAVRGSCRRASGGISRISSVGTYGAFATRTSTRPRSSAGSCASRSPSYTWPRAARRPPHPSRSTGRRRRSAHPRGQQHPAPARRPAGPGARSADEARTPRAPRGSADRRTRPSRGSARAAVPAPAGPPCRRARRPSAQRPAATPPRPRRRRIRRPGAGPRRRAGREVRARPTSAGACGLRERGPAVAEPPRAPAVDRALGVRGVGSGDVGVRVHATVRQLDEAVVPQRREQPLTAPLAEPHERDDRAAAPDERGERGEGSRTGQDVGHPRAVEARGRRRQGRGGGCRGGRGEGVPGAARRRSCLHGQRREVVSRRVVLPDQPRRRRLDGTARRLPEHDRGHVDVASPVDAANDTDLEHLDLAAGLPQERDGVHDLGVDLGAHEQQARTGQRTRLRVAQRRLVAEVAEVGVEPVGATLVGPQQVGAAQTRGVAGVLERPDEALAVEDLHDVDDDRSARGVECEQVRAGGVAVTQAHREQLLTEERGEVPGDQRAAVRRARPRGGLHRLNEDRAALVELEDRHAFPLPGGAALALDAPGDGDPARTGTAPGQSLPRLPVRT